MRLVACRHAKGDLKFDKTVADLYLGPAIAK